MAKVQVIQDEFINVINVRDFEEILKELRELCQQIADLTTFLPAEYSKQFLSPSLPQRLENIKNPSRLVDIIAEDLNVPFEEKQKILELIKIPERYEHVSKLLKKELERLRTDEKVLIQVQDNMRRVQGTYYLREYVKAIKN
jgi:ATP-dependent Lon protease